MKVYGYLRVSSDRQDYQNQRRGVDALAARHGWVIDRYVVDDGVSGTVAAGDRNLGRVLLGELAAGDVVICSELSRLGRRLLMVMGVLEYVMARKARLYTVKEGYVLGDNVQAMVLAFGFGLSAQVERDMISLRTREALACRRDMGVRLGRPRGARTRLDRRKLHGRWRVVLRLLDAGVSRREIARRLGVDRGTVSRWIRDCGKVNGFRNVE